MKEILFRGKDIIKNDWWYGSLIMIEDENKYYITQGLSTPSERNEKVGHSLTHFAEIDKDTIGQFTGLLDKNGKKIFEGDIVSFYEVLGQQGWDEPFKGVVKYGKGYYYVEYIYERNKERRWDLSHCWHLTVVGNIYDNKELENDI